METIGLDLKKFDPSILKGATAHLYMDTGSGIKKVLFIKSIRPQYNYNLEEIRAIGDWFAKGAHSKHFSGTFSAETYVLEEPEEGTPALPVLDEILTAPPLFAELRTVTKRVVRFVVKLQSESFNVSWGELAGRNLDFLIIRVQHLEGYN